MLAQSADYVHALRARVEEATGALSIFITGAAGDINPRERGVGYAGADAMGKIVGDALDAPRGLAHVRTAPVLRAEHARRVSERAPAGCRWMDCCGKRKVAQVWQGGLTLLVERRRQRSAAGPRPY